MLRITKIFHFESAHAILEYDGKCRNIHGHSYELHVTVTRDHMTGDYLPAPSFIIDFKVLKQMIREEVIDKVDHQLLLSQAYLKEKQPGFTANLLVLEAEPSAENLLIYFKRAIEKKLPASLRLAGLKLFETKDSYAEWVPGDTISAYSITTR
jgi:6-pyruvoyltetrahydropterin/6-carboxytetrahydropterin synthase